MKKLSFIFRLLLALWFCVSAIMPVLASNRVVNNLNDSGTFSLRYWIANAAPGDSIVFSNGLNALTGTIVLTNGELIVGQNLTIIGPGATNLAVSGNSSNRIFNIATGVTAFISGLSITNGKSSGTNGADSFCNGSTPVGPTAGGSATGGAILNAGNLTLSNCILAGNKVVGGRGGDGTYFYCSGFPHTFSGGDGGTAQGGAVYNGGTIKLLGCTVMNNSTTAGSGGNGASGLPAGNPYFGQNGGAGGSGFGGGIFSTGTLMVVNCTFASNNANGGGGGNGGPGQPNYSGGNGGNGGNGSGAAFAISTPASLSITNCTISGNSAIGGGGGGGGQGGGGSFGQAGSPGSSGQSIGGIAALSGSASLKNTIIALNSGSSPDVSGAFISAGFNFIGITNGSSGWVVSDLKGTAVIPRDPLLGPLQDNGGPTPTMALLAGSVCIDYGNSSGIVTDQRGVARPNDLPDYSNNPNGGDGSDIGAYEYQAGAGGLDIGLRLFDGRTTNKIAGEYPAVSPLRIRKNGTNYGVLLIATNSPVAAKFRVQTSSGIKALQTLP